MKFTIELDDKQMGVLIKAQLNAVDAGLFTAVEAFLPNLEGQEGLTVSEFVIPRLRMLGEDGGSRKLLEGPT